MSLGLRLRLAPWTRVQAGRLYSASASAPGGVTYSPSRGAQAPGPRVPPKHLGPERSAVRGRAFRVPKTLGSWRKTAQPSLQECGLGIVLGHWGHTQWLPGNGRGQQPPGNGAR